ncbi:hypothetical protein OL229_09070 [Neisseriaceae bacterium JH1-16]|nr:hypothetical protein [Neisseriaceae bacterium JH1-16]
MAQDIELDQATKARLAEEVELLVREGMDKRQARQIVWLDYLDELKEAQPVAPPEAEPEPPATPVPEPPTVTKRQQAPPEGCFFTPERLARNRQQIQQVKQFLATRRSM